MEGGRGWRQVVNYVPLSFPYKEENVIFESPVQSISYITCRKDEIHCWLHKDKSRLSMTESNGRFKFGLITSEHLSI